jgi:hypothetical protein
MDAAVTNVISRTQRPGQPQVRTLRVDAWWWPPVRDGFLLGVVLVYSTWAALQTGGYAAGPLISPIFSPCLASSCGDHGDLTLFGDWWTWSPALLVVIFPVGFRLTCYYYRKVYYRSYFLSPPACAVAEPRKGYRGESRFPLILNNIHRYFWVFGGLVSLVLLLDAGRGFHFSDGWGVSVGSLVLTVNAALFTLYTVSCHSCRHILGGRLTHFSKHPLRYRLWTLVSRLNARHQLFAWTSLPAIPLADLYVRLVAHGVFTDFRFF